MQLPQTAAWVPLRNSEPPIPSGGKWLGAVDPSEPIMITIHVRPGIRTGPGSTGTADSGDFGDPSRHWRYELGEDDKADQADLDRVREFARDAGLDVIEVSAARRSIVVWGTAAAIADAFRVELAHYERAGKAYRVQIGPVHLPPTIAHIVEDVSGLHDSVPNGIAAAIPSQRIPRFNARRVAFPLLAFVVGTVLGVHLFRPSTADRSTSGRANPTVQRSAARPADGVPQNTGSPASRSALYDPQLPKSAPAAGKPAGAAASNRVPGPPAPPLRPADDQVRANGGPPHPAVTGVQPVPGQERTSSNGQVPQPATPEKAALRTPTSPANPVDAEPVAAAPQKLPDPGTPVASRPASPAAAPSPPTTPPAPPQTSAGESAAAPPSNRLYMVRIGPLTDRNRAAVIAKQLSAGGFTQTQVTAVPGYRVLSEPLPRQAAERLAVTLAARGFHTSTEALTGDTVRLVFGQFVYQKDAEKLSSRIAAAGYDAWIHEAPLYTVHLGPYPPATVATITDIVRANAPDSTVAKEDVYSQSSPAPATPPRATPPLTSSPQAPAAPPSVSDQPPRPAPVSPASPPSSNPVYMVRIGPVSDHDRATAVAKQLSTGGFAEPKITVQTGYRVVSEPLPRKVAEDLVATLARRGLRSYMEPLKGDSVQLLFGAFTSQTDAETLSSRVAAAGYDAWVREGSVYFLRLGPYPQASVNSITGIVRAGAPEAAVATDPASTP